MSGDPTTWPDAWTEVEEGDDSASPEGFAGQWMLYDDQQALKMWIHRLQLLLPWYTCLWCAVHFGSVAFARLTWGPKSSIRPKDKFIWHNKCG
jgi:hypothetical protein